MSLFEGVVIYLVIRDARTGPYQLNDALDFAVFFARGVSLYLHCQQACEHQ